jgi:DNA mismatch repair protein MSH4
MLCIHGIYTVGSPQSVRDSILHAQLQYAAKRGFYLIAPRSGTEQRDGLAGPLPDSFIQLEAGRSRATVSCTTHELNALNARLKDATSDCMVLTEQVDLL